MHEFDAVLPTQSKIPEYLLPHLRVLSMTTHSIVVNREYALFPQAVYMLQTLFKAFPLTIPLEEFQGLMQDLKIKAVVDILSKYNESEEENARITSLINTFFPSHKHGGKKSCYKRHRIRHRLFGLVMDHNKRYSYINTFLQHDSCSCSDLIIRHQVQDFLRKVNDKIGPPLLQQIAENNVQKKPEMSDKRCPCQFSETETKPRTFSDVSFRTNQLSSTTNVPDQSFRLNNENDKLSEVSKSNKQSHALRNRTDQSADLDNKMDQSCRNDNLSNESSGVQHKTGRSCSSEVDHVMDQSWEGDNITGQSCELNKIPNKSFEVKNSASKSLKVNNMTKQSSVRDITGQSYEADNITGQSSETVNITGQSYEVNDITGQSYEVSDITGQSYEVNDITGQSYEVSDITGQSYEADNIAGQSSETVNITGQSYEVNDITGQSSEAVNITGQSSYQMSDVVIKTDLSYEDNNSDRISKINNRTNQSTVDNLQLDQSTELDPETDQLCHHQAEVKNMFEKFSKKHNKTYESFDIDHRARQSFEVSKNSAQIKSSTDQLSKNHNKTDESSDSIRINDHLREETQNDGVLFLPYIKTYQVTDAKKMFEKLSKALKKINHSSEADKLSNQSSELSKETVQSQKSINRRGQLFVVNDKSDESSSFLINPDKLSDDNNIFEKLSKMFDKTEQLSDDNINEISSEGEHKTSQSSTYRQTDQSFEVDNRTDQSTDVEPNSSQSNAVSRRRNRLSPTYRRTKNSSKDSTVCNHNRSFTNEFQSVCEASQSGDQEAKLRNKAVGGQNHPHHTDVTDQHVKTASKAGTTCDPRELEWTHCSSYSVSPTPNPVHSRRKPHIQSTPVKSSVVTVRKTTVSQTSLHQFFKQSTPVNSSVGIIPKTSDFIRRSVEIVDKTRNSPNVFEDLHNVWKNGSDLQQTHSRRDTVRWDNTCDPLSPILKPFSGSCVSSVSSLSECSTQIQHKKPKKRGDAKTPCFSDTKRDSISPVFKTNSTVNGSCNTDETCYESMQSKKRRKFVSDKEETFSSKSDCLSLPFNKTDSLINGSSEDGRNPFSSKNVVRSPPPNLSDLSSVIRVLQDTFKRLRQNNARKRQRSSEGSSTPGARTSECSLSHMGSKRIKSYPKWRYRGVTYRGPKITSSLTVCLPRVEVENCSAKDNWNIPQTNPCSNLFEHSL